MKPNRSILLTIIGFTVLITAFLTYEKPTNVEQDVKAKYLKGGNFSLSNEGSPFTLSELAGQPVILYFGFTFCPDVCPVGLATIRDALNSDPKLAQVKSAFVTLDPERDTAKRLTEYVGFFHENIIGLTGSLKEIEQVAKQYGTYFRKSVREGDDNYLVDHTAYFYLIDKQGALIRVLDHDASAEDIANLLVKML